MGKDGDHPSKQSLDIPFVLVQHLLLLAVCPAAQQKIPLTLAGVSGGGIKTRIMADSLWQCELLEAFIL